MGRGKRETARKSEGEGRTRDVVARLVDSHIVDAELAREIEVVVVDIAKVGRHGEVEAAVEEGERVSRARVRRGRK